MALGQANQAANIAFALLALGRTDEAQERLHACERGFYVLDILGSLRVAQGEWSGAEEAFRLAIEDHESQWRAHPYVHPYLHLGALYLRQGRLRKAEAALLPEEPRLLDHLARRTDYHELLLQLFEQAGDDTSAASARAALDSLRAPRAFADGELPRSLVLNVL